MLKFVFNFGLFWAPFWSLWERLLGAKLAPTSDNKSIKKRPAPQDRPKTAQEHPKSAPREPKRHPKGAQEQPKGTQEHPKGAQEHPESTQESKDSEDGCAGCVGRLLDRTHSLQSSMGFRLRTRTALSVFSCSGFEP